MRFVLKGINYQNNVFKLIIHEKGIWDYDSIIYQIRFQDYDHRDPMIFFCLGQKKEQHCIFVFVFYGGFNFQ